MFDFSLGEIVVVFGLGVALAGKKDLPKVANYVGTQVGRLVGTLQGARARADRYAANNELRQLQNELRAGLRELDAVRSEMAVSMSPSRGMIGRELGATVGSANRIPPGAASSTLQTGSNSSQQAAFQEGQAVVPCSPDSSVSSPLTPSPGSLPELPPENETIGAVAEYQWKQQGIHFTSKAEMGSGANLADVQQSGSAILSGILQESLIFSQYDRLVQEQQIALQSKVDKKKQDFDAANEPKEDSSSRN